MTEARGLDEWHEDHSFVVWWTWRDGQWLGEPSYIGSPLCDDWPGYHTHWTPHPSFPAPPDTGAGGGETVTLVYTNYRGETAERVITPKRLWFGATEWHPEPQWFLKGFDHDKQTDRDFALKDFGTRPATTPDERAVEAQDHMQAFQTWWDGSGRKAQYDHIAEQAAYVAWCAALAQGEGR
jgi:hypothetical protein